MAPLREGTHSAFGQKDAVLLEGRPPCNSGGVVNSRRRSTNAWRLDDAGLRFIDTHLDADEDTIETGAGLSTILFAMKRTRHTCIVPDARVVERIRHFCDSQRIGLDLVQFVVQRSEDTLPLLGDRLYDFALIDGRHGFPTPFIDRYYISRCLRLGGAVIVDDLQIWTCQTLVNFLKADPGWLHVVDLARSAVSRKLQHNREAAEWTDQPFVYLNSAGRGHYAPGRSVAAAPTMLEREDDAD